MDYNEYKMVSIYKGSKVLRDIANLWKIMASQQPSAKYLVGEEDNNIGNHFRIYAK